MPEVGVRLRPLAIAQGALAELAKARSERLAAEGAMVPLKRARFAANLAMLYAEHPFLHRFRHAAAAGFRAVEISHPEMYAHAPEALAAELEKHQLTCELFNMPPGDWSGGERGIGALAGREADFDASVRSTIEYARALKCPRVHCLSGLVEPGAESDAVYRRSLRRALDALAPLGVDVLIEPINQRSIPDFYLRDFEQAAETIDAVGAMGGADGSKPQLLFDFFHAQIIHGDVTALLRRHIEKVGHIQIAGVPDRHEPDEQNELNYPFLFRLLGTELGWGGFVGCEYNPRGGTDSGLGWLERSGLMVKAVELSADASAGATLRVSNHKRAILVSGEITKVRDVLRALDGGKYIPSLKGWCYPGKMCRQILAVLRADPSNTVVDETQSG